MNEERSIGGSFWCAGAGWRSKWRDEMRCGAGDAAGGLMWADEERKELAVCGSGARKNLGPSFILVSVLVVQY